MTWRWGTLLASALCTGCMGPWPGDGKSADGLDSAQIGFLYVGPVGDHGWTLTHELGRNYLGEQLDNITSHYEPSVLPADAVRVMEEFVADGDDIIFTTSHDFLSATQTIAANYPDVKLLSCSGFVSSPNLGSYFGRMHQAKYLAGLVAGSMSCTGKIGVVAPVNIPEVVRHINAFALGVREANPQAEVIVYWVGNWFDLEIEPIATERLLELGVDVIQSATDTTIPLEVAAGATTDCGTEPDPVPVYTIGYDNPDSCEASPERCLTSPYWNWGPLYTRLVSQILDGSWDPSEIVWDQMQSTPDESVVHLSEINPVVPAEVRFLVDEKIPALVDPGGIHLPFRGEIRDTHGRVRVAAGDELSDEDLLEMCWYVEGISNADAAGEPGAEVPAGCGGVE